MKYKIVIAVAVDHEGSWNSMGWGNVVTGKGPKTEELFDFAIETLYPGERRYLVEVEIELPAMETIQGVAVEAGK